MVAAGGVGAQSREPERRVWVGAGVGGGAVHDSPESAVFLGQVIYQDATHHLGVRAVIMLEPLDGSGSSLVELGLLYGRTTTGGSGHASIAAGIAVTELDSPCDDPDGACGTLGIPIVAEASLRLLPVLGLGAQAFANLNPAAVYGGLVLFVQLGWLG